MIELKPCPFCGCRMEIKDTHFMDGEKAWRLVGTHDENCMFEYSYYAPEAFYHSEAQKKTTRYFLVEAWNRRATDEENRNSM